MGENKLDVGRTGYSPIVSFCEHANKGVTGGNSSKVILY
jgi:hypothetical protein